MLAPPVCTLTHLWTVHRENTKRYVFGLPTNYNYLPHLARNPGGDTELEEWWRNEQFWLISGTSFHLAACIQGLLKVIAGIEISFTLTSKSAGNDPTNCNRHDKHPRPCDCVFKDDLQFSTTMESSS
ncbi:hypothetical protein DITRI_Ditri08aG0081400 [Diplodiscus trichospermus]